MKYKKIINKLRLIVKLRAWNEINQEKYKKYLQDAFSCYHCKYNKMVSLKNCEQNRIITTVSGDTSKPWPWQGYWCFVWLNPENWVDVPEEKYIDEELDKITKI